MIPVADFDLLEVLTPQAADLPLMLSFGFGAVATIAVAWAIWIHRTMKREAELLRLVQERTTELEAANARLETLSYADALTGVANRRAFERALDVEWRRGIRSHEPLTLLLIDIDHFKGFNDAYGHQAGDTCLATVAEALGACVRRAADCVARYGGEEFAALLPATDVAGGRAIAERMRAAVEALQLASTAGEGGIVTVSIGYATIHATDSNDPADLVAAADAALYEGKRLGRNRVAVAAVVPAGHAVAS